MGGTEECWREVITAASQTENRFFQWRPLVVWREYCETGVTLTLTHGSLGAGRALRVLGRLHSLP